MNGEFRQSQTEQMMVAISKCPWQQCGYRIMSQIPVSASFCPKCGTMAVFETLENKEEFAKFKASVTKKNE